MAAFFGVMPPPDGLALLRESREGLLFSDLLKPLGSTQKSSSSHSRGRSKGSVKADSSLYWDAQTFPSTFASELGALEARPMKPRSKYSETASTLETGSLREHLNEQHVHCRPQHGTCSDCESRSRPNHTLITGTAGLDDHEKRERNSLSNLGFPGANSPIAFDFASHTQNEGSYWEPHQNHLISAVHPRNSGEAWSNLFDHERHSDSQVQMQHLGLEPGNSLPGANRLLLEEDACRRLVDPSSDSAKQVKGELSNTCFQVERSDPCMSSLKRTAPMRDDASCGEVAGDLAASIRIKRLKFFEKGKDGTLHQPTSTDWEDHRQEIEDFYPRWPLESIRNFMVKQYNFNASKRMFKARLKKWGLEKNIKSNKMLAAVRKTDESQMRGKRTCIKIDGVEVSRAKLLQFRRRKKREIEERVQRQRSPTPPGVEVTIAPSSPMAGPANLEILDRVMLHQEHYVAALMNSRPLWKKRKGLLEFPSLRLEMYFGASLSLFNASGYHESHGMHDKAMTMVKNDLLRGNLVAPGSILRVAMFARKKKNRDWTLLVFRNLGDLTEVLLGENNPLCCYFKNLMEFLQVAECHELLEGISRAEQAKADVWRRERSERVREYLERISESSKQKICNNAKQYIAAMNICLLSSGTIGEQEPEIPLIKP